MLSVYLEIPGKFAMMASSSRREQQQHNSGKDPSLLNYRGKPKTRLKIVTLTGFSSASRVL